MAEVQAEKQFIGSERGNSNIKRLLHGPLVISQGRAGLIWGEPGLGQVVQGVHGAVYGVGEDRQLLRGPG
jgi:hypothetical protein